MPTTKGKIYLGTILVSSGSTGAYNPNDFAGTYSWYIATEDVYKALPSTVALDGDNVTRWLDQGLNGHQFDQTLLANQPVYNTGEIFISATNQNLILANADIPVGGLIGTMVIATADGSAAYRVNIPAGGDYNLATPGTTPYLPSSSKAVIGVYFAEGAEDASNSTSVINYFVNNGAAKLDYGDFIDFSSFWRNRTEITEFPLLDTSSGTNFAAAWYGCTSLTAFPLIDTSSGLNFSNAWRNCSQLSAFPLLDTSSGENFSYAWYGCNQLSAFPLIDTSSGTSFSNAWNGCSQLTSFPLIDTSSGLNFGSAWRNCSQLSAFPLIDTSSGTSFSNAWYGCSQLTAFPLLDTSSGLNFSSAWQSCSSLTSFPLLDTSSGADFRFAWRNCSQLSSFPLLDTSTGLNFSYAWSGCSQLTSFPLIDASSGTNFQGAWQSCTSLATFPSSMFDSCQATNYTSAFTNCALTAPSVKNICESIATAAGDFNLLNGTLGLDGGTNAAPNAAAQTAIDFLVNTQGWSVTTN